jgi:hypothetical protein
MTDDEFNEIMVGASELRGIEFKGPGAKAHDLLLKVLRAILGLANTRDGGAVIIGVVESRDSFDPVGLSDDEVRTWIQDDLRDAVAAYSDPPADIQLERKIWRSKTFVAILVAEFKDYPIVCKRDGQDSSNKKILRNGACYVRSRRKPETVELPNHMEMRDLLELALQKRLRDHVALLVSAGVLHFSPVGKVAAGDDQMYDDETPRMWS